MIHWKVRLTFGAVLALTALAAVAGSLANIYSSYW